MLSIQTTDKIKVRDFAGKRTAKEIAEKVTAPRLHCQGIFAILTLMRKTSQILGFINQSFPTIPHHQDHGLSDFDLPLVMMYDESKRKVVLRREGYPDAHLDCFDEFTPEEIVAFEKWQWSVLDEQLLEDSGSAGPNRRCERWHYDFKDNDQVPLLRPRGSPHSVLMRTLVGKDSDRAGPNGEVCLWALTDPTRSRPMHDGAGELTHPCARKFSLLLD